jgi:hypothetical protein
MSSSPSGFGKQNAVQLSLDGIFRVAASLGGGKTYLN